MSSTMIIHDRLYKIGGLCYFDDETISEAEFYELAEHYSTLVEALARPWKEKDADYDTLGRYNKGGMSEYEERF